MATELAIRTEDLTKQFDRHIAVNGVELAIEAGEVYGLIGPNGYVHFNKYCVGKFIEGAENPAYAGRSNYSENFCTVDSAGDFIINWAQWWSGICFNSGWIVFAVLILGSVYMLVADLINEEKRGTMSFIRLSPRSPRQIFIGKILGVPVLVYLAVAWMIPLHLLAGIKAGASLGMIASWYIAIGSFWFLLSSAAILYVLLGGGQAILTTIAVATPIGLFFRDSYQHFNFKPGFSFDKGWTAQILAT